MSALLAPLPVPSAALPCPASPIFRVPLSRPCAAAMSPFCCSTPCQQHWCLGYFTSTSPGSMSSTCHCPRHCQHYRRHCLLLHCWGHVRQKALLVPYTPLRVIHLVLLPLALHTPRAAHNRAKLARACSPFHTTNAHSLECCRNARQRRTTSPAAIQHGKFACTAAAASKPLRSTAVHTAQYSCDSPGRYTSRTAQYANPRARAKQADESTKDTHDRADPQQRNCALLLG